MIKIIVEEGSINIGEFILNEKEEKEPQKQEILSIKLEKRNISDGTEITKI